MNFSSNRQNIRNNIRHIRRTLSDSQQKIAAARVAENALNFSPVQKARNIAVFLSIDGEVNTCPLIAKLWRQGKQVYLPVLHPFSTSQLLFLKYDQHTELKINRLQVPEPLLDIRYLIPLSALDVLMLPLVAFNACGQRLGMGGGFYDRTLQNWQQYGFLPVGLAHDCQQVENIPVATWDVLLPALITPSKIWQW